MRRGSPRGVRLLARPGSTGPAPVTPAGRSMVRRRARRASHPGGPTPRGRPPASARRSAPRLSRDPRPHREGTNDAVQLRGYPVRQVGHHARREEGAGRPAGTGAGPGRPRTRRIPATSALDRHRLVPRPPRAGPGRWASRRPRPSRRGRGAMLPAPPPGHPASVGETEDFVKRQGMDRRVRHRAPPREGDRRRAARSVGRAPSAQRFEDPTGRWLT